MQRTWTSTEAQERAALYARHPDADERIFSYVEDVLTGREDTCRKVRLACERFIRDLMREADEGCPWIFDGEKASRPIRFTEKWMRPRGDYDSMVLMPWQCFFLANVFGWIHRAEGYRKHTKALLVVGSGNGKTPLVAAAALYLASQDGVRNAEVDVLANSQKQSALLMDDCRAMVEQSPALSRRFRSLRTSIEYYQDGLSGKSRSAVPDAIIQSHAANARTLDGLRPTAAVFDEIHEARTYDMIVQLRRSLDKCRDPLLLMCSTMGYVLDGVLVSEYRLADQMLKGIGNDTVNERSFALIYELDEDIQPDQHEHWIQANPSLGVLLRLEQLQERWEAGRAVPALRADFLTKQLNLFTRVSAASFLDWSLIQRNQDVIDLETVRGREAYGGFDISVSGDHTSVCLEVPLDDGRMLVIPHTFVPRSIADRDAERLDYYSYAMQGLLTIIEGDYIRQELIVEWFEKWAEVFDIRCIGYDPANATLLVRSLSSWRGEDKPIFTCDPVRQGALTLNAPMKDLKERFLDGMICYNQNRLFEWYLNNVKLRQDFSTRDNENWVPTKLDKYSKIDAFMAFLDAHTAWMRRCPAPGTIAAEPGFSFFALPSRETEQPEEPGILFFSMTGGRRAT